MLTDSLWRYPRLAKDFRNDPDAGRYPLTMYWLSCCHDGRSSQATVNALSTRFSNFFTSSRTISAVEGLLFLVDIWWWRDWAGDGQHGSCVEWRRGRYLRLWWWFGKEVYQGEKEDCDEKSSIWTWDLLRITSEAAQHPPEKKLMLAVTHMIIKHSIHLGEWNNLAFRLSYRESYSWFHKPPVYCDTRKLQVISETKLTVSAAMRA